MNKHKADPNNFFCGYELTSVNAKEVDILDQFPYLQTLGDYHSLPLPWKVIPPEEFWDGYANYSPKYVEHRQVIGQDLFKVIGRREITSVQIFYFHNAAYAILIPTRIYPEPVFLRIGCDHANIRELSLEEFRKRNNCPQGNFWHVWECTDCGFIQAHDSSG